MAKFPIANVAIGAIGCGLGVYIGVTLMGRGNLGLLIAAMVVATYSVQIFKLLKDSPLKIRLFTRKRMLPRQSHRHQPSI